MTTNTTAPIDRAGPPHPRTFSRYLPIIARVLMGLLFFIFGLNGFLNFIPRPTTPMPEGAMAFFGALMKTRYMLPMIAGTEVIVGALLLVNRLVPLGLVMIAPLIVNIVAFHIFLSRSGLEVAIVILLLEIYLVWAYRRSFGPLFARRTTLGAGV